MGALNIKTLDTRILLVEDSWAQAEITTESLERNGYEVILAQDGASAMKAVKTIFPQIVLLDLVLPDMSGMAICRWIKANDDTKGIPVIMLTAKGTINDKVSGIEAGADDYLPKPYNEIELNMRIYAALRTRALQDELREKNRKLSELLAKVEALSITDHLTGLFNRRHLKAVIEAEWKKVKRYGELITCLLMDVDDFKSVNDTYGHLVGDSVLVEIARILEKALRETDTAARWGGEEFCAILPYTSASQGFMVARKILAEISDHTFAQIPERRVTVSIGLAFSGTAAGTYERLFKDADTALYAAKRKGKNRVEVAMNQGCGNLTDDWQI
jgi:diguanylate cyclase (GGDEF)-like protein